jgi:hypothetical protein
MKMDWAWHKDDMALSTKVYIYRVIFITDPVIKDPGMSY